MKGVPIKRLARDLGLSTTGLILQLNKLGVDVTREEDTVTAQQQLLLIRQMKSKNNNKKTSGITLDDIRNAKDLRELNGLLTQLMAKQKIQALIRGDDLDTVVNAVVDRALSDDGNREEKVLLSGAILGRLAGVARGREDQVFSRLDEMFSEKPLPIEILEGGDEKHYAARSLAHLKKPWLVDYCLQQVVLIDTAENARKTFLNIAMEVTGNLTDCWHAGVPAFEALKSIDNTEAQFKRIRRITRIWLEAVKNWQGDVGGEPGQALAGWLVVLLRGSKKDVDAQVLIDIVDDALGMLLRLIELRFSFALLAPTYEVLEKARYGLGREVWSGYIRGSNRLEAVRLCLKEAALVLARQNRADSAVMDILCKAYYSRAQVIPALKSHFSDARELEPDIRDWWLQAGVVTESQRKVKHQMGNSEDQQIGSLLIEVEASRTAMEKLKRAVVPFLEISDPPLAATVKRAAAGYGDMARIARQLSRMRKLTHTDLLGSIIEYNPMQHEMLGGHRLGVRTIKVVREGIQKDFGGKVKILVKPWVESADD